jgi:hypothetical protein
MNILLCGGNGMHANGLQVDVRGEFNCEKTEVSHKSADSMMIPAKIVGE